MRPLSLLFSLHLSNHQKGVKGISEKYFISNIYIMQLLHSLCFITPKIPEPKPPDVTFTLCVPYTSKTINYDLQKMVRQIKALIPDFHVHLPYKGFKLSNLFSADAAPKYIPYSHFY
jgi:hypothetical protein